MWHNKYGSRIINPKGYTVAKRTQETMTHSHRHSHDDQQHTHQHDNNKKEHTHEHKHPAIIYGDERGYTIIELDRNDLKLWKKDEMKFNDD